MNERITIDSMLFRRAYENWLEQNKTVLHPMTKFYEEIGLSYRQTFRDGNFGAYVEDDHKYFLAKIKYGF